MSNTKITVEGPQGPVKAVKVAFATKDMENINAHFGGAKEFVIYDIAKEGYTLSEIRKTDTSGYTGDDKTDYKVKALEGVNIMYCESIGGTAAAKVIRSGISPMKIMEPRTIESVLKELIAMLNGNPPPWIKRIMNIDANDPVRNARWAVE